MYKIYVVQPEDTLETIASKNNVTTSLLEKINGMINNLYPGMQIVVPSNNDGFMSYIVKKGDTLYSIANNYGVSLKNLTYLNGLNENDYIYPNQEILIPSSNLEIYMTVAGDTLKKVANILNISENDIIRDNASIYLEQGQPILYKREK